MYGAGHPRLVTTRRTFCSIRRTVLNRSASRDDDQALPPGGRNRPFGRRPRPCHPDGLQIRRIDAENWPVFVNSQIAPRLPVRPSLRVRPGFAGWSRHSVLSSVRELEAPTRSLGTIAASLVIGCLLIGIAVALMVEAGLGLSPYDVFSAGISDHIGISLGQAGWLVAALLFGVAALLGQRPTGWSVLYVLGNGVAIDATAHLINAPESMIGRTAMVVAAVPVMAFGITFVLHAGVTGGAFELIMNAGQERGIDPIKIRYGLDIGVLLGGIVLGGPLGVATIFYAASMAVVFARMRTVLEDHRAGRAARLQAPVRPDSVDELVAS